jgi:hypothetical protein
MAPTWSSDHSAIYRGQHLHLAVANDLSLKNGIHKDRLKRDLNAARVSIQLLSPNAHPSIINKIKDKITQGWLLDAPGLVLLLLGLVSSTCVGFCGSSGPCSV